MKEKKEIPQLQEEALQYMSDFYRESHKFPTIPEIASNLIKQNYILAEF